MREGIDLIKLRQEVRDSRQNLGREYAGLLEELDMPKRFARSVRSHPLGWIGGAATAGFLLTAFGRSGRTDHPKTPSSSPKTPATAPASDAGRFVLSKAGIFSGALQVGRLLYPVLRPVILEYASKAASVGLERIRRPRS